MASRLTGFMLVTLWLGAMSWLVWHDVWPAWTAQDVPRVVANDWLEHAGRQGQWGIYMGRDRIGTIWTTHRVDPQTVRRSDVVSITDLPGGLGALRLDTDSTFRADGLLDEFTLDMVGDGFEGHLHGERFHADFSFELKLGSIEREFKLPLSRAGMISGAFSPLANVADLEVGQRWRIQVANPIAAISGLGDPFMPILVEVVGEEKILTPDGEAWCKLIKAPNVTAWVTDKGETQRQEISLPLGVFRLEREAFVEKALQDLLVTGPNRGRGNVP